MNSERFQLKAPFRPSGDQPQAIQSLRAGLTAGRAHQTLLGVTGSGKTFTIANLLAKLERPTLVIAPNKTLAAQLAAEFRLFFPDNSVGYFVSYYDYYQPEAYVPATDTYIEKETDINDEIDRLRHAATAALLLRRDVIIVATVSCIYGLGSPAEYAAQNIVLTQGADIERQTLLRQLIDRYYERSEVLSRGTFRAHGPVIEIMPPDREMIIRLEMSGNRLDSIREFDGQTRTLVRESQETSLFPAKHFVAAPEVMHQALSEIEEDLKERLAEFDRAGKLIEAERLERRTYQDLELLRQIGTCSGIENYSRYFTRRAPGEAPDTLLDFFPADFLLVIDESHVTVPQIGAMYEGDRSRKQNLVDYGFRLPAALDNRPLKFSEFTDRVGQTIYVSATPGPYELKKSLAAAQDSRLQIPDSRGDGVTEQIVRPTGLVDPEIIIHPAINQIPHLIEEIKSVVAHGDRVLVTTLTKKQSEQLQAYLAEHSFQAGYLHSEVPTIERLKTLEALRRGEIDILVGVNLLREGLDLPEVALVAVLDADKEGFLRSETSLIQTMGRAARNIRGRVILYADRVTGSMHRAMEEARRRRTRQVAYNTAHGITPKSIEKAIQGIIDHELVPPRPSLENQRIIDPADIPDLIRTKERLMRELAKQLKFEEAALVRNEIIELKLMVKIDRAQLDK